MRALRPLVLAALFVTLSLSGQQTDRVQLAVGPPAGAPRQGAALEAELERTASVLRCPVCQGLSINDSPAEMAVNMKAQVREMLARGYSREQTIEYFERSYGEFVRLEPKREGLNWVVWLAPLAGLIAGAFLVRAALQRNVRARSAATASDVQIEPIPDDLLPWVERIREMVARERAS